MITQKVINFWYSPNPHVTIVHYDGNGERVYVKIRRVFRTSLERLVKLADKVHARTRIFADGWGIYFDMKDGKQ